MTKLRAKKVILLTGTILGVFCLLLSWPMAAWLWCRERWASVDDQVDAVYLVAGASQQAARVCALSQWMSGRVSGKTPMILVSNDRERGKWSSEHERNLTAGEWAVLKVDAAVRGYGVRVKKVSGCFSNTDGEMEALAEYLRKEKSVESIALVTSAFHARRTVNRLLEYMDRDVRVMVVTTRPSCVDRAPWIVIMEIAKMMRDRMGLARAPILSRG